MSHLGRWGVCASLAFALGCHGESGRPWVPAILARASLANDNESGPIVMSDVTREAGIAFRHDHGGSGRHYYLETMGSGCAFFDYDGDEWLDVFLLQGAPLPGSEPDRPLKNALYRNNGDGTFTDTTDQAGLGDTRYGMGCCTGDFDNDGYVDLFLTNLEGNILYRNNGDGTFSDVTEQAGVGGAPLCTSAAFVDYNHDGFLDLFICRYMDYDLETNPLCRDTLGRPAYCSPFAYAETSSVLYRNNGDGTFTDVSEASGIAASTGRALGIACADYNDDGWIDIYIASDLAPNLLFLNNGDGTFREEGAIAGVAYGVNGTAQAGMGVDVGDLDNDGRMDLVVTNFENEPNALYRNIGDGYFLEESSASGLGNASHPYLGWGIKFVDLDGDGFQDLFVVNGHVNDYEERPGKDTGHVQPCHVFHNQADRTFSNISPQCGPFFSRLQVARGAAFGDFDNDGDIDVLIACNNQPAVLLRNDSPQRHHWVRLILQGTGCNRDAIGARVQVQAGPTTPTQFVRSGSSYLSDHDRRLLFGLGPARHARGEVRWPCGAVQSFETQAGETLRVDEQGCRIVPATRQLTRWTGAPSGTPPGPDGPDNANIP